MELKKFIKENPFSQEAIEALEYANRIALAVIEKAVSKSEKPEFKTFNEYDGKWAVVFVNDSNVVEADFSEPPDEMTDAYTGEILKRQPNGEYAPTGVYAEISEDDDTIEVEI